MNLVYLLLVACFKIRFDIVLNVMCVYICVTCMCVCVCVCVCGNKGFAKVKSSLSVRKMLYWSSDDVLLWLKKNCNNSYKLYGKLFKDHCITGWCVTCMTAVHYRSVYYLYEVCVLPVWQLCITGRCVTCMHYTLMCYLYDSCAKSLYVTVQIWKKKQLLIRNW